MDILKTQPYKGMRDFYPDDMVVLNYIFKTWQKVCGSFGYLEYEAPILEETLLYEAKSGEEIVNEQTYSFVDRGGRKVTMRPEMTPTVARLIAKKRKELTFPVRWFSMPQLFRYEAPQKGRLREHYQLNVDMFGLKGKEADLEILQIAYSLLKNFGAKDEMFEIRLNNRKLMDFLMKDYLGLDKKASYNLAKLIDKKNKVKPSYFKEVAKDLVKDRYDKLEKFLNTKNLDDLDDAIKETDGFKEIKEIKSDLEKINIKNVKFDSTLMRGFDYYDGLVFEVFDVGNENNRSLLGGGRYDGLVDLFGVESVPVVGFGMGDVTIKDFMETYKLLPINNDIPDLYICQFDLNNNIFSNKISTYLRKKGLKIEVDLTGRKIGNQIKTALRKKIKNVLIIGEEEKKTGLLTLKNLEKRQEKKIKKEEIKSFLNKK